MKIISHFSRSYPRQHLIATNITHTEVTAVLTGGARYETQGEKTGNLAVYIGVGSLKWIAHNGVKQTYKDARTWFPDLDEKDYRK